MLSYNCMYNSNQPTDLTTSSERRARVQTRPAAQLVPTHFVSFFSHEKPHGFTQPVDCDQSRVCIKRGCSHTAMNDYR